MSHDPKAKLQDVLSAKKHRKIWLRVVRAMMAVVVFCTTYALILPAITMGKDTYCGIEEHTHTDACYQTEAVPTVTFTCTSTEEADFLLHTHDENCCDSADRLICTLTERQAHTHETACYSENQELICEKPEVVEHTHGESCYGDGQILVCGQPQIIAHQHTEDCRSTVAEKIQICTPEADVLHHHDELCYDGQGALVCTLTEQGENGDAESKILICGEEETPEISLLHADEAAEEHTHTESCYAESKTLTCEEAESEGHAHTEDCYDADGALICEIEETEGHTHAEDCYDTVETLICSDEPAEGHTHTESCYSAAQDADGEETDLPSHQHEAACFEEVIETEDVLVLSCGKEEHTHEEQCFEQPEALTFTYEDEIAAGVITLPWDDSLPSDLSCTVVKLDSSTEGYGAMLNSVSQAVQSGTQFLSGATLYQLEWTSNGERYTLPDNLVPSVELTVFGDETEDETLTGIVLSEAEAADEPDAGVSTAEIEEKADSDEEISPIAEENGSSSEDTLPDYVSGQSELDNLSLPGIKISDDEAESAPTVRAAARRTALRAAASSDDEEEAEVPAEIDEEPAASPAESDDSDADAVTYAASAVSLADGTASLRLTSANLFAVARSATAVADGYYKRVDSVAEIQQYYNSGYTQKYAIVYANSVCLAFGTDTWYVAPIEIQPIKGYDNEGYCRLVYVYGDGNNGSYGYYPGKQVNNPTDYKARHWQIKPHPSDSSAFYIWENEDTSDELWTSYSDGNKIYLEHDDTTNTWRIRGKTNYMAYSEDDQKANNITNSAYMAQTNMLIFRYVGGTREILDDIAESANVDSNISEEWTNYDYSDYIDPSDAKEGSKGDTTTPVKDALLTYASDPATSDIESEFGSNTKSLTGKALYAEQSQNDGRVLTDKSVIYGTDDYGASDVAGYGSYDNGDFSVTLSALGQEWMVEETYDTTAPLDVVYILDISNSMVEYGNEMGGSWVNAMNSINTSMKAVLEQNPLNRVGLVAYSNTSKQILPLDRYTTDSSGNYLESTTTPYSIYTPAFTDVNNYYHYARTDTRYSRIQTASGLRYAGDSDAAIREAAAVPITTMGFTGAWDKTYTQSGIQEAYDTFLEMAELDSSYTTFQVGDTTLSRQPVIILVTDGDPTICTYNYMYPKDGPTYGQGASYGAEGYYTILSANYFKNLTSILYQRRAGFYTIGINCRNEYTQAVLEPTVERINSCRSGDSETSQVLYNLLNNVGEESGTAGGTFTQQIKYGWEGQYWHYTYSEPIPGIGINTPVIRGVHNPYTSNFNYCDKAWFGEMTKSDMDEVFADILDRVHLINNYNFLLKPNTSLVMTDHIGDSMAVKGTPVLRFYGQNYAPDGDAVTGVDADGSSYVEYRWTQTAQRLPSDSKAEEGTDVPLSGIKARITTAQDGSQTVQFTVPEEAVPTYYPDLYKNFYYEELPVRLIYRVGLSDDEVARLQTFSGEITDQTYYTSLYDDEDALTTVCFTPDSSNPYYTTLAQTDHETAKTSNPTGTTDYSWKEYMVGDMVVQLLGNNGKLTLSRPEIVNITVQKRWDSGVTPTPVRVMLCASGTQIRTDANGNEISRKTSIWPAYPTATVTLSESNNWTYEWTNLPMNVTWETVTYEYVSYFVCEVTTGNFSVIYQDGNGLTLTPEEITVDYTDLAPDWYETKEAVPTIGGTVVITNTKLYALPHAGGVGTDRYIWSGTAILFFAFALYTLHQCRKKKQVKGGACGHNT